MLLIVTEDQNAAVFEHGKWCQETIVENEVEITQLENLKPAASTSRDLLAMVLDRIERLKSQNQTLRRFLERVYPLEPNLARTTMRRPNRKQR